MWLHWAIVKADLKLNKELMKLSKPDDMTGLVSETSDRKMTFRTDTYYLERISSEPLWVWADPGQIAQRKERMGGEEG